MELLKSQDPVYYDGVLKRKITGVIWRRDVDSLVASVEVLDDETDSISYVGLDKLDKAIDEDIKWFDVVDALVEINKCSEILEQMKASLIYERVDKAKDGYNRLMRRAIKLDEEIQKVDEKSFDKKVIAAIDGEDESEDIDVSELDYETIKKEDAALDERIESFEGFDE